MFHGRAQTLAGGFLGLFLVMGYGGCSRAAYRKDADREAYAAIAERNDDPRWKVEDYSIDPDPRSRFYDEYDPDDSPMPPDDPAAHRYMRAVYGIRGWEHWEDRGVREEIENPGWREELGGYVDIGEDGAVRLDLDAALDLAYLHSSFHQRQLETLYLSALDVTRERFRLDTQYFGGYGFRYTNTATRTGAGDVDRSSRAVAGGESEADPTLQASQFFAAGGQLLAGFANSVVWELTGSSPDFSPSSISASLFNFSIVQPLLRGAGKDVALEQLTLAERNLLGNLRAYSQFRRGFYTLVAIGELGVSGPRRSGPGADVQVSRGGGVGGYLGLLEQLQRVRNTEDNLDRQLRTLAQLEAHLDAGLIDLVQVDQFRQSIQDERARLLRDRDALQQALDDYKTDTLGLPPDVKIDLDDGPIRQFKLLVRAGSRLESDIVRLQRRTGSLSGDAPAETIARLLDEVSGIAVRIDRFLGEVRSDVDAMEDAVRAREGVPHRDPGEVRGEEERGEDGQPENAAALSETEEAARRERDQLRGRLAGVVRRLEEAAETREALARQLRTGERQAVLRGLVVLLGSVLRALQGAILVQARARLEMITVTPVRLDAGDAYEIALANRLDFMNARAALVDSWRSIQRRADALQSELNITASGTIRTTGDEALDYHKANRSLLLGLEFDAPFTRLLERNDYRESLIDFQQARRSYIQSRDSLHRGLRALIRDLARLRTTLEIRRRGVVIAIRRVDLTRAELYAPVRPPLPGQRPAQFGPTAAINLLSALSSLRDSQNSLLDVWLAYDATRLRLYRELGIMKLDGQGRWVETEIPETASSAAGEASAPDDGESPGDGS